MSWIGSISNYEHGEYHVVEWQIPGFSTLSQRDGTRYDSPTFSFGGETWFLVIWPNGASRHTSGHVDLCLIKCSSDRSIRVSLSLSLKTAERERHREEHIAEDFDAGYSFDAFFQFISRSELGRLDLLPDDILTVVCTMKRSTSVGTDNSGECRHCKENFAAGILSSHQRKCEQRPVKCPDCLEVIVLQKFLDEHECCQERQEGSRSLCEDKRMLLDGQDHNLILKVGDKELRAHRDVLRVRSRVFESMLDHDMKEKNTGVIDVPDCDPDAMQLFLLYVYCGKIEALDHGNMLGMYYIADKYEMMELKRECCNFIKESLSVNNICSVIQLALNHSDSDLLDCATVYFADNMLDIMQTVEWQSFLKENTTVGNELMIKSIKLKNAQS